MSSLMASWPVTFLISLLLSGTIADGYLQHSSRWEPAPGQPVPYDFTTPTLDGTFSLKDSVPVIIFAYEPTDAFLRYMWSSDSSVLEFVSDAPPDVNYLFTSYGLDATNDTTWMKERLLWAMDRLDLAQADRELWLAHLHFSTLPMTGLSDIGANFIPSLMGKWRASRKVVARSGSDDVKSERLDASYDWLPAPPGHSQSLAGFGDGCSDPLPYDVAGKVALVLPGDSASGTYKCSYAHIISAAQAANASGVVISAEPGSDVVQFTCEGRECELPLRIWATSVPHTFARELRLALAGAEGADVSLAFSEEDRPGYFAAVDGHRALAEVGWLRFPKLMHMGWAAQWLLYEADLRANLSRPALVVPVFEDQIMQGERGVVAHVTLPHAHTLEQYDKLELDFTLGCPGTLDADCPTWDHVVQLFVCCADEEGSMAACDKCDVTPWLALARHEAEGREWVRARQAEQVLGVQGAAEGEPCGRELGRWITPFRRRVGRWLTEVTPLWPLLSSRQCRFQAQTAPWALPWKPSLSLRFSKNDEEAAGDTPAGGRPQELVYLFSGGTFDSDFNNNPDHRHIRFSTPAGIKRAVLEAVITGHGSDEHQCAEFCVTSHCFRVNGAEHWVNFTRAGTPWGCTKTVREGGVPNEHGTWQYGRDGWCDGQNVRPWLANVTEDLHAAGGRENVVEYEGLFEGRTPDPKAAPGYIMMESSLALYVHDDDVRLLDDVLGSSAMAS